MITMPFKDFSIKLRLSNISAILYHNIEFVELVKLVTSNPLFIFDGRHVVVFRITGWLKLHNRMDNKDLDNLQMWLKKDYPLENLELWELAIKNGACEYYMHTGSRESAFYLFNVMIHFHALSNFDNRNIEQLTAEEKEKFVRVYPEV